MNTDIKTAKCCTCKEDKNSLNRAFVVDHCHKTNKVREFVCTSCNKGLGYFKDNVNSLQNAINYLIKHKGEK